MDEEPKWAEDFKAPQPQNLDITTSAMQLSPVPISIRTHPTPSQHSPLQQLPGRTSLAHIRIRPAINLKPPRLINIKVIKSDIPLTLKVQKLLKSIIILQP
jgi:hypothetical protein